MVGGEPADGDGEVGPVVSVEGLVGGEGRLFTQLQPAGLLAGGEFGLEPLLHELELGGGRCLKRIDEDALGQGQVPVHLEDPVGGGLGAGAASAGSRRHRRLPSR